MRNVAEALVRRSAGAGIKAVTRARLQGPEIAASSRSIACRMGRSQSGNVSARLALDGMHATIYARVVHELSQLRSESQPPLAPQRRSATAAQGPAIGATAVRALQRTAGNRATADLLARAGSPTLASLAPVPTQGMVESKPASRLPDDLRSRVESLSGVSLANVAVHYDSPNPAAFSAAAYAQGNEIHVGPGQERHLGHEAWHCVQQATGRVSGARGAINRDSLLEHEADAMSSLATGSVPEYLPASAATPATDVRSAEASPVQLRDTANPYAAGGSITSHHIIPHSLLVKTLPLLTDPQRERVLGRFLPGFDDLTVETLVRASIVDAADNAMEIRYSPPGSAGGIGTVLTLQAIANDNPAGCQLVSRTKFGSLAALQRGSLTFSDAAGAQPFATFETRYRQLAAGNPGAGGFTGFEPSMVNTFFEWQSGNQFYGPDRHEPRTKDDFDSDARFVLGGAHTEQLRGIYDRLLELRLTAAAGATPALPLGQLDATQQSHLEQVFTDMAEAGTVSRPIPANDASKWVRLDTNAKEAALASIEGYNRIQASGVNGPRNNTYRIHIDLIPAAGKPKKDLEKVREVVHALQSNRVATILYVFPDAPGWVVKTDNKSGRRLFIEGRETEAESLPGGKPSGEDIKIALDAVGAKAVRDVRSIFGI